MTRRLKLWLLYFILSAAMAFAGNGQRDPVREAGIVARLAGIDSSLVAPFEKANEALDRGDYAQAEKLYRDVLAGAPRFDPAMRRLGGALSASGHQAEAVKYCENAVAIQRSPENLYTLAVVMAFPQNGSSQAVDRMNALYLLEEARKLPGGLEPDNLAASAQLALGLEKLAEARAATNMLQEKFPNLMQTHYFAAIIAAVDERWIEAESGIREAEKLGLPHESVQKFLDSGVHTRAAGWGIARITGLVIGAWAAGLGLLFGLGFILSKLTLHQANRADPTRAASRGEKNLRRIYRWVINVAGIYYYVSLPVIVVLVLGLVALLLYAFLMLGRIPIQLMLVLGIGGIVTVWSLLKSLFVRVKSEDPGRALERKEAEGLWLLTEEVARDMNTRPIDEIRLTLGTDLAVYERGTWRQKMENRANRILILGTAVLDGFRQDDFRAVLAHEYGHFSHRDTAGGDMAMRVQNDIMKFYYAMRAAGQATWMNVAFHFLRLYNFIFRRISHGATRLQEILADRVAAQAYGAPAFEGGLRHVISQSILFNARANREIDAALKAGQPVQNLYTSDADEHPTFKEEFEKSINRPTTEDDTHPGPMDRFRLISRIPAPARSPVGGYVWDLFADRAAVEAEMMTKLEENISRHRDLDWKKKQQAAPDK